MRIEFGAGVQRTADHVRGRNATLYRRRTARGCRPGRLRFQYVRHQVTHGILKNLTKISLNRHLSGIHLPLEKPTRANKPRIQSDRGGTMEEFVCRSVRVNIDRIPGGSSTFSKKVHNRAHAIIPPGTVKSRRGATARRVAGVAPRATEMLVMELVQTSGPR